MGIFQSCLRVKADGAKVDVTTNVKDLVNVTINPPNTPEPFRMHKGSSQMESDKDFESKYLPTEDANLFNDNYVGEQEVINIVKILLETQPVIYIDEKNRIFTKAISNKTRYRDKNGEYFLHVN